MRENRPYGSEGGGAGNSTGSPYPYLCTVSIEDVGELFRG